MKPFTFILVILAYSVFPADYPQDLPAHYDPALKNPIVDAIQIWRLGIQYFKPEQGLSEQEKKELGDVDNFDVVALPQFSGEKAVEFTGIEAIRTIPFIHWNLLKPVIQFSCARGMSDYEDSLERALANAPPEARILALSILMRVKAPHSVELQYKALQELKALQKGPLWTTLLSEMEKEFDPQTLEVILNTPTEVISSPEQKFDTGKHFKVPLHWAVRAAGVIKDKTAVPRLAELSTAENTYTSLAAEKSLEDFSGKEADQALAKCLLGWRYNAYINAAEALLKRDKELLNTTLMSVAAPEKCRYMQGIYLAMCDNPAAVPILCDTVPHYQMVDSRMFGLIEHVATADQLPLIKKLPERVREDQKAAADAVLRKCLDRFNARK